MSDEGYVKYKAELLDSPPPPEELVSELNAVRVRLYDLGLIGMNEEGIGFGNLSMRSGNSNRFVITGTSTGDKRELNAEHYCEILSFDTDSNSVKAKGRTRPSSEAMSHGAVYEANPAVRAVIHVHNLALFDYMIEAEYPATPAEAEYGTPAISHAISSLVRRMRGNDAVFVSLGHVEGVFSYGSSLETAEEQLMDVYREAF